MRYTKEIPVKPGWYWVRAYMDEELVECIYQFKYNATGKMDVTFGNYSTKIDDRFEYSDRPIPEPEE